MKNEQRRGFVGPFILVGIGILFLLNNLGLVQVNFWRLALALWPVMLIGIGLDMLIGRRSARGSLLVLLITAAFLVGGAFFVGISPATANRGAATAIRYAPGPVDEAEIHIATVMGSLTLNSLAEAGVLVDGTARLGGNETLTEAHSEEGGKAIYRLGSDGVGIVGVSGNDSVWDLRINDEIPTNLDVSTGAGETELHLERLRLTGLHVSLGVGAATITLPRSGVFDGEISGGIGKLVVRVPDSLAVRLHVSTGIGQVQVGDGFSTAGEKVYLSDAAKEKGKSASLKISSGIGQVVIESVKGE